MTPVPYFDRAAEDYAPYDPPTGCDPIAKPGVEAFRDYVVATFGGSSIMISRDCNVGPPSHHHEGRAWDWKVLVNDPIDVARAESVFAWLLGTGPTGIEHEMARRVGLNYMIWNKKIWSSGRKEWSAYDGYDDHGSCTRDACLNPHVDHVHFSFSKDGANGSTSFYRWLDQERPMVTPGTKVIPTTIKQGSSNSSLVMIGGALIGAAIVTTMLRRRR